MEQLVNRPRVALLSNVNMNFAIRMLKKSVEIYEPEGYGNELGLLMNPGSTYHAFAPEVTFLVTDLMEMIGHEIELPAAKNAMQNWFEQLNGCITESGVFYVSDAYLYGPELAVVSDALLKESIEHAYAELLRELCGKHGNVRIFPYRALIEELGSVSAFADKTWYLGKILHSNEALKRLCALILEKTELERRTPKKVLVLDLDNTLWGGLAGENDITPIALSDDHEGLAYKNLQRMILQMQKQGVLLAIASKNNEEDAAAILADHPHMMLRPECFAAKRINWNPKNVSLTEIAEELNLGLDSFVFFDDNPAERELIRQTLPQVEVPDFPEKCDELPGAMARIYKTFFEKNVLTGEDLKKTEQYAQNAKRDSLMHAASSFEEYLKQLEIEVKRVDPKANADRLTQLLNKTNQFHLTTKRMDREQVLKALDNASKRTYLYSVADRFGDNGIVAAVMVDVAGVPLIEEFVMSCRVMGRNIEQAILADVERSLLDEGYESLHGVYLPTAKNKPVSALYERLGYQPLPEVSMGAAALFEGREEPIFEYELNLKEAPERSFFAKVW